MDNKTFWLDANANLIEIGHAQHNSYASELLINEMGIIEMMEYLEEHSKYPYEILHDRGWVRISIRNNSIEILGGTINLVAPMRNTLNPKMNAKQLIVVKKLCNKYNYDFYNAINDKQFHT